MPLFYALFPRRVLAAHPSVAAALCVNQGRLVTPFDIHATLRHLLSYPAPPALPDWSDVYSPVKPRSLLVPIPDSRTCDEAGIKHDDCAVLPPAAQRAPPEKC